VVRAELNFIAVGCLSLTSVKTAAEHFANQHSTLDILMCNAGIMALPPGLQPAEVRSTMRGFAPALAEASRRGRSILISSAWPP
jgi:NAD(P)-dependent dehydrogenase (short-subunit alcohol dehydrogenase family)